MVDSAELPGDRPRHARAPQVDARELAATGPAALGLALCGLAWRWTGRPSSKLLNPAQRTDTAALAILALNRHFEQRRGNNATVSEREQHSM